jgi:DNA-binding NarL/FixJ family response regulator
MSAQALLPVRYRVVVADDHPFILLSLRQIIAAESDFELVGEARTGLEALRIIKATLPDVAVLDLAMPELNGAGLTRRLREDGIGVRVVILTSYEDEGHLTQALAAGAAGFVVKRAATESLIPALRAVLTGGTFVHPSIAGRLAEPRRVRRSEDTPILSAREEETLKLTALGYATKEIANQLGVGAKTVETYRLRASEKLGLKSRADIVRYALTVGWLTE